MSIRVRQMLSATTACSALLGILFPVIVAAQSNKALAQGFTADSSRGTLVAGTLVSTQSQNRQKVQLAATDNASRLVGVIDKNPLLTISAGNNEVAVVLSGTTAALVSDINGAVHSGDKVAVSPVAGVGMRATTDSQTIGTAQSDFTLTGSVSRTIADSNGKRHTIHIGYVPLQVGVSYYQAPGNNFIPPVIQNAADGIAGRTVSLIRILICGVLLLIGIITVVALVYSSIHSAMTSIGRNPLAAGAIRKSMYQVFAVALGIFAVALLGGYIVLKV